MKEQLKKTVVTVLFSSNRHTHRHTMSLFTNWNTSSRDVISSQPTSSTTSRPAMTSSYASTSQYPMTSQTSGDLGLGTPTFAEQLLLDPEDSTDAHIPEEMDLGLGASGGTPFGNWRPQNRAYPSVPSSIPTLDLDVNSDEEEEYSLRARHRVLSDPIVVQPQRFAFPRVQDQENDPEDCNMGRPTVRRMDTCCCSCYCEQTEEQARNADTSKDIATHCMKCCLCPGFALSKLYNRAFNWTYDS